MTPESIQQKIQRHLPNATVSVQSEDHIHYQATVSSPDFKGMSTLEQHRAVYAALQDELKEKIHALQLTTTVSET